MANRGPVRRGKVSSAVSGAVRRGHAADSNDPTVGGGTGGTGGTGPPGPPGTPGADGAPGTAGAAGAPGASIPGLDGLDGEQGLQGPPGGPGRDGSPAPPAVTTSVEELLDEVEQRIIWPPQIGISQELDQLIGTGKVGDVLVRGANGWTSVIAPAVGLFLAGNGPGIVPSYQQPFGVASPFYGASAFQYFALSPSLVTGVGIQSPATLNGIQAPAGGTFTDAYYVQFLDTTTLNSQATMVGTSGTGVGPINFLFDFDVVFVIRTDVTAVTSTRFFCGFSNGNPGAGVDAVTANSIMFRYSTIIGEAGFVGLTYDGTQAITAVVQAIAANTRYALRIRKVGGTVFFSVNGGTEVSTTSHVPTNDVFRIPVVTINNPTGGAGTARSFYFSRMFCNYGT